MTDVLHLSASTRRSTCRAVPVRILLAICLTFGLLFTESLASLDQAGAENIKTLTVTKTQDGADQECEIDCTLREAFQIIEAAGPGDPSDPARWIVDLIDGEYILLDQFFDPVFAPSFTLPDHVDVLLKGSDATINLRGWSGGRFLPDKQALFVLGNYSRIATFQVSFLGLGTGRDSGDYRSLLVAQGPGKGDNSADFYYSQIRGGGGNYFKRSAGIADLHIGLKTFVTLWNSSVSDLSPGGLADSKEPVYSDDAPWSIRAFEVTIVGSTLQKMPQIRFHHNLYVFKSSLFDFWRGYHNPSTGRVVLGIGPTAKLKYGASDFPTAYVAASMLGYRQPNDLMPSNFQIPTSGAMFIGSGGRLILQNSTVYNPFPSLVTDDLPLANVHILENVTIPGRVSISGVNSAMTSSPIVQATGGVTMRFVTAVDIDSAPVLGGDAKVSASIFESTGPDCSNTPWSIQWTVTSDSSCGPTTISTYDLRPLGWYGGPTPTRPHLSTHPAFNLVPTPVCYPVRYDQRFSVRPVGHSCDAGAVEIDALDRASEGGPSSSLRESDSISVGNGVDLPLEQVVQNAPSEIRAAISNLESALANLQALTLEIDHRS